MSWYLPSRAIIFTISITKHLPQHPQTFILKGNCWQDSGKLWLYTQRFNTQTWRILSQRRMQGCKSGRILDFKPAGKWRDKNCKQSSKYQKGSARWNECTAAVTRYLSKGGCHFKRWEKANSRKWFKHRIASTSCLVGTTLSRRPWPTCRTKLHRWEDQWCKDPLANNVLYMWSSVDIKRVNILLQHAAGNYWKSTQDLLLVYNAFICLFC